MSANKRLLVFVVLGIGGVGEPSEEVFRAAVDKCLSEGLKVVTLEDMVMGRDFGD